MRKNIWLLLFLIFLFITLMARCVSVQFFDNQIGEAPIEIAPYPERTVELVNLYFGNENNEFLVKEKRAIERTIESTEEVILKELINGPREKSYSLTIPQQTRLFSVTTVNGTSYVNLSKEFATNFFGGEKTEATTIYSIVNSLTELRNVKRVQILVEGERLQTYHKYLSLKEPYSRNEKIIGKPFQTPIEVIHDYFKHLEEGEYRRAFDLIYRPLEYDLDYAIFFHFMRSSKVNVKEISITTYNMTKTPEGGKIILDYIEELNNGNVYEYKDMEFLFINDFGEWKIVYKPI